MSSGQIWTVAASIFGTQVINATVFNQVNNTPREACITIPE